VIAFLIIVYVAIILVLFEVLRIKPTAYDRIHDRRRRVHDRWRRGGLDAVGAHHGQNGYEPIRGAIRLLRERAGQDDLHPGASTHEERRAAAGDRPGAVRDAYAMFTKVPPVTPFEQSWSVWGAGFGGSQTTDGNAALGSNTSTSSVFGTVIGADYRISPFTVAGFALAGGGTNFSVGADVVPVTEGNTDDVVTQ